MAQAVQPGAQQGRGLHVFGENPARGANKGLDAQALRPITQGHGIKVLQHPLNGIAPCAVAPGKGICTLGVGQVQPPFAGQQKLAPHRGHGIKHMHGNAGILQHLRGHQASGAAANDGDGNGKVHGVFTSISAPCGVKNAARISWPGVACAIAAR